MKLTMTNTIKKSFWSTNKADLIFLLLFAIIAVLFYDSFLTKGPFNNHAWRQTDCLSLAHFYKEGTSFFSPEMHNQLADGLTTGKSAGEFPILYYIVGKAWSLTGESYLTYRLIWLVIMFSGIFAFYKALRLLWGDWFWSMSLPLLLFCSPLFVAYGVSFLTDAPAFCFALISGYFLVRYYRFKKWKHFIWFVFFFTLVGWLKISSLIGIIFICGIYIFEMIPPIRSQLKTKLFVGKWKEGLGLFIGFLLIFAWYYYAGRYNLKHGYHYTFNNIFPFSLMSNQDIADMKLVIWELTSYQFFGQSILVLLALVGITNLFLWKKMSLTAYLSTPIILIGCCVYFYLWAPLLGVHDYYWIALLIITLAILIPFINVLNVHHNKIFRHWILKSVFALFLVYNLIDSYHITKFRTLARNGDEVKAINEILFIKMEALNGAYAHIIHFEDLQPMMRAKGISPNDKVISIPDPSFSISLYLMNQKGWTASRGFEDEGYLAHLIIDKGAKYFVINNSEVIKNEFIASLLGERILKHHEVEVFKTKVPLD